MQEELLVSLSRREPDPRYPTPSPCAFVLSEIFFGCNPHLQMACSCQILARTTEEDGEMLRDQNPSVSPRPDHSRSDTADATTICAHPAARCEEYAADEAGDPHATERDENASGIANAHGGRASSSPLRPPSPSWPLSSSNRYNTKSSSSFGVVVEMWDLRRGESLKKVTFYRKNNLCFLFLGTQKNIKHKKHKFYDLCFMFRVYVVFEFWECSIFNYTFLFRAAVRKTYLF